MKKLSYCGNAQFYKSPNVLKNENLNLLVSFKHNCIMNAGKKNRVLFMEFMSMNLLL